MYGIGLVRFFCLPPSLKLTNTTLQPEVRANEREDEPKSQGGTLYFLFSALAYPPILVSFLGHYYKYGDCRGRTARRRRRRRGHLGGALAAGFLTPPPRRRGIPRTHSAFRIWDGAWLQD